MNDTEPNFQEASNQETIAFQFENIKSLINEEKLGEAKILLLELHPADLADLIDNSSAETNSTIFGLIEKEFDAETLVLLSPRSKACALETYSTSVLAGFITSLTAEDSIDFFTDIDDETKNEILELVPEEKRLHILEGFNYPEGSAGRVMAKKFINFYDHWTVGQAIDFIRKNDDSPENFHSAVIVNTKNKPVGTIALSMLLKQSRNELIKNVMNEDLMVADTLTNLDDLSYLFKHYALTVVPVINKAGKIVGTISIDNMVYIIEEQAEDAILHLGGVYEGGDIYETFLITAKQRFPWLFINLITACLTAIVINYFGPTIAKIVALASLMPIVASMGGNAGTQTMTVTIMAITNKDVTKINNIKIVLKELLSCGINGIAFAILGAMMVLMLFNDFNLAKVFASAVVINFILGGILGSSVPLILNRLKMDPAPSSGVIVNALTDSCGFLIFLGLAKIILIT